MLDSALKQKYETNQIFKFNPCQIVGRGLDPFALKWLGGDSYPHVLELLRKYLKDLDLSYFESSCCHMSFSNSELPRQRLCFANVSCFHASVVGNTTVEARINQGESNLLSESHL